MAALSRSGDLHNQPKDSVDANRPWLRISVIIMIIKMKRTRIASKTTLFLDHDIIYQIWCFVFLFICMEI
jgi:hypothetical protein